MKMNPGKGTAQAVLRVVITCVAVSVAQTAAAQAWPAKPVRFILPYPPGGSTDLAGRLIAADMAGATGQQFVVDNRAGAAGNIGVEAIAHAAPDGYTIGLSGMGPSVLTHVAGPKPPFAFRDLAYIAHSGIVEMMLVANPASPFTTVRQVIDAARAAPGKLSYGHGGTGSPAHLSFELFNAMAGTSIAAVAYKGDGPALTDIVGGQVPIGSVSVAGAISHVKSGRVRPIAVYSAQRSPSLADVPTVAEAGLPGFEAGTFNVLIGPAALPAPVVQRLNTLHNEAMGKPALRERYLQMGMVTVLNTPQQTTDFLTREMAKWARVIKEANIQIQ